MQKVILLSFILSSLTCQAQEEIALYNGKDLSNWSVDVPAMDTSDVASPFIIRDGLLVSMGNPPGHLVTNEEYENYQLNIEYRFAGEPGNCGILVHASTPRSLYKMFPKSIEVQMMHENAGDFWCIVENIEVENMVERRGPKDEWGIREGEKRRVLNLTDDSENPVGEWNKMTIECLGNEVKVWLNGDFLNHGFNSTASKGKIALQAEGSEVEVRKFVMNKITDWSH